MDCITVLCTVPDAEAAERIASAVVEEKAAACASIIPSLTSVYRWKGEICRSQELLLVMKTKRELFPALQTVILSHHPYELPEIVAFDITEGYHPYLEWIGASTLL